MTNSPYIVEAPPASFNSLVLENSERGPVMEQLLEIVRHDRTFRDDAGRKGLIAIFNMLGHEDEAVSSYRALLTEALN